MVEVPLSLMSFKSDHLLKYSIQTTKSLKQSTSGRLYILIPTSCITRILWSLHEIVLIFLCFWPWLDFLINCSAKSLILCHNNLFEVFCIDYSFPEGEVIALAFESCPNPLLTLLIIVCCCYEQETTNLVLLWINCPWKIEKDCFKTNMVRHLTNSKNPAIHFYE